MNKLYSMTGIFHLVLSLAFLLMFSKVTFSEQTEFTTELNKVELNRHLMLDESNKSNSRFGLSLKGKVSNSLESGFYQLKIDDIKIGWNGEDIVSDLKLIFSFRYKSQEPNSIIPTRESAPSILSSFKEQMDKQDGQFFMSIGKSW